ncbi:MAG TPA: DUF192 domain-containing protein [Candidatus Binataceae bacterium]|nr:DUF192 domain-containing protein [Candidatus Binataceae bacterium]
MKRAINLTRGNVLCANVEEAHGAMGRGKGLMGRKELAADAGLLIGAGPPIQVMWIHTFFMRFAIDLVFLDRAGRIVRIIAGVRPWRLTAPVFGACCVLELEAGAARRTSSAVGDEVRLEGEP